MGTGYPSRNTIIRSWPGGGTGDTHYQTADSRVWVPAGSRETEPTTATERGQVVGNEIWTVIRR